MLARNRKMTVLQHFDADDVVVVDVVDGVDGVAFAVDDSKAP
jgi:hypothetical protein